METNSQKLVELKNTLRKEFSQRRSSISKSDREIRSNQMTMRLLNLNEVVGATNILAYWSFGSEAPTRTLIKELSLRNKRILLPYLESNKMHAARFNSTESLATTTYGPLEPTEKIPTDPSTVEVIVVPGLAFDRNGFRLGYGRGFYHS
jgi:5-formyltetrahydrofolate cyclo-ligase